MCTDMVVYLCIHIYLCNNFSSIHKHDQIHMATQVNWEIREGEERTEKLFIIDIKIHKSYKSSTTTNKQGHCWSSSYRIK